MAKYTVAGGDSLALIARKVYGNERMAQALSDYNGGVMSLHPGDVLDLPEMPSNVVVTDSWIAKANASDVSGRQMAYSNGSFVGPQTQAQTPTTTPDNPMSIKDPLKPFDWSPLGFSTNRPTDGRDRVTQIGVSRDVGRPASSGVTNSIFTTGGAFPTSSSGLPTDMFSKTPPKIAQTVAPENIRNAKLENDKYMKDLAAKQKLYDSIYNANPADIEAQFQLAYNAQSIPGADVAQYMPKVISGDIATGLFGATTQNDMLGNGYVYNSLMKAWEFRGIPDTLPNEAAVWEEASAAGMTSQYTPYYNRSNLAPLEGGDGGGGTTPATYNSSGRWNAPDSALSTRSATG